jgi:hypothetical protein
MLPGDFSRTFSPWRSEGSWLEFLPGVSRRDSLCHIFTREAAGQTASDYMAGSRVSCVEKQVSILILRASVSQVTWSSSLLYVTGGKWSHL